jgi:membrane fusion protein, multidrug efflux system
VLKTQPFGIQKIKKGKRMAAALMKQAGSSSRDRNDCAARAPKWLLTASLVIALTTIFSTGSAKPKSSGQMRPQTTSVVTATARQGDLNVTINGLGSVLPLQTVTVKSRVDGQIMKIHFQEGQAVNAGFLLAEIDPRPYAAQLKQAEGQLLRDQALLDNARLDLKRYKVLTEQDSIARQQLDTQEALVRQYEGTVKIDQGTADNARLQLAYCRITSPIAGRIGLRLVDVGNIIHATDTGGLAIITQLQPITVLFSIPEDNIPAVVSKLNGKKTIEVEAWDRAQQQKLAVGTLITIDNQIDPTTGTVKLKALFPNSGSELFPNQFVNAKLLIDTKKDAIIIPQAAVQRGQNGTFVYMVKPDMTASVQSVKLGPANGDEVSIEDGLSTGQMVVVEGADKLREGSKVDMPGRGNRQDLPKAPDK